MKFLRKLDENTVDILLLAKADRLSARGVDITEKIVEENISHLNVLMTKYFESLEKIQPLPKLLDGNEIMQILGISPSPLLGKIISELKIAQEDGNVYTREDALIFVNELFLRIKNQM